MVKKGTEVEATRSQAGENDPILARVFVRGGRPSTFVSKGTCGCWDDAYMCCPLSSCHQIRLAVASGQIGRVLSSGAVAH